MNNKLKIRRGTLFLLVVIVGIFISIMLVKISNLNDTKTITFFGDSLTYGSFMNDREQRWTKQVSEQHGYAEINLGVPGSTIAENNNGNRSFISRLDQLDNQSEFLVIWGGVMIGNFVHL